MPTTDDREPLDPAVPAGATGKPDDDDLDEIPSFLRSRHAASARAHVPAVRVASTAPSPDLAALPMLGVAPRRLLLVGAGILLVWLVASFGRQVAEASAASARADELRATNAALAGEVSALEQELQVIQDQRYISQAARAFRLGSPEEIPFALEAGAPSLPPDAPGSAAVSLGAGTETRSPLDRWLDVLFGPGD